MENKEGSEKALLKGEKIPFLDKVDKWTDKVETGLYRGLMTGLSSGVTGLLLMQGSEAVAAHHPVVSNILSWGTAGTAIGITLPAAIFVAGAGTAYVGLQATSLAGHLGNAVHDMCADPNFKKEFHDLGVSFKNLARDVFHPSAVEPEKAVTKDR